MHRKVLILIDWYLPGYKAGGPIQSCVNIVKHFNKEFDFSVCTSDRDLGDDEPYPEITVDEWNVLENGTRVFYFSPKSQKLFRLLRVINDVDPDVIYMNSMFSKFFTLYPLFLRKVLLVRAKMVVAPRGMLGKGALAIKATKKESFLKTARLLRLYKHITWHASTAQEAKEIKDVFGESSNVIVGRNLTAPRKLEYKAKSKIKNVLKIVFLSRISVKKNLLEAIEFISKTKKENLFEFDIYGPVDEKDYWTKCLESIAALDDHVKCNYKGAVSNDRIADVLSEYHVMILPTRHENFGHAIVESMAAACVILISDQTPWRDLAKANAGWDLALSNKTAFTEKLELLAEMDQEEYSKFSKGAFEYAKNIIEDSTVMEQNRLLFE